MHTDTRRTAGWLPGQHDLEQWLEGHRDHVGGLDTPLHPVVQKFADELAADPVLRMGVTRMIEQVPHQREYEQRHIRDVDDLLRLISGVLTVAPEYGDSSMIMLPLAAILDWTMATPSGYAIYRDKRVNSWLRELLDEWARFLDSADSRYVLNDSKSGWLSTSAIDTVGLDQFEHDPTAPYYGFASWNDFFARRLRDGARPVASPADDAVIANACESTPYRITTDAQRESEFWIKGQPYSLRDLLGEDESVDRFVGGTVYQAFLSAVDYHRWHSPVSGTVLRTRLVPGTYYSEADSEGSDAADADDSQSYLAHVSTRAIVILEADNPAIGQVAFVAVGMLEVSSCVVHDDLRTGRHLAKGDELGHFAYGGSTHCLVFEPDAVESFAAAAIPQPGSTQPVVPVRSALARARA